MYLVFISILHLYMVSENENLFFFLMFYGGYVLKHQNNPVGRWQIKIGINSAEV